MKNNKYFEEDEEDLDDFSVEENEAYDRWYWGEDDPDLEEDLEEDDDSYLSFYPTDEDDEDDY